MGSSNKPIEIYPLQMESYHYNITTGMIFFFDR
jgi:hypothetical protein